MSVYQFTVSLVHTVRVPMRCLGRINAVIRKNHLVLVVNKDSINNSRAEFFSLPLGLEGGGSDFLYEDSIKLFQSSS